MIAVPNGHFARQHIADTTALTFNDLWVDVGASSGSDVAGLGIALMDPVALDRPAWSFADHAAGPNAGARASCAAVVAAGEAAARQGVTSGETSFVLSTQRVFGWVGLSTALVQLSPINELYLADDGRDTRAMSTVSNSALRRAFRALTSRVTADSVNIFAPAVQFVASAVETVHNSEANDLMRWVARGASVRGAAMGPDRDASAFVAHMDEVGFEVDRILPDGHGTLRRLGGAVTCSWEGVPARLHLEPDGNGRTRETLRGVFVPRSAGRVKTPDRLTARFGLDSAQLVSRGVERGFSITAYKRAERLAGTRVTARGTDDRAGSAALLAALLALDTTKLNRRVYFTWTTAEEVGLRGAGAFGNTPTRDASRSGNDPFATIGRTLSCVYSIDTFVSSDTPLESPHFAFAPLGAGPVLRALDDSNIVPRRERARLIALAREVGIPLQVGTTQDGTDGGAISPWGPFNIGLSWPGRYSHRPAEILDLKDVDALARLIRAVAEAAP